MDKQLAKMDVLYEDLELRGVDYREVALPKAEYARCSFSNCSFAQTDLGSVKFEACTFVDCDLSMAKIEETAFRDVTFIRCKLLGLRFDTCAAFGLALHFEYCALSMSSFEGLKLKKTAFTHCKLDQMDFTGTDLSGAVFDECDLHSTLFERTILKQADLRTAYHFTIDPESNVVTKARFSKHNLSGLLYRYNLHIDDD